MNKKGVSGIIEVIGFLVIVIIGITIISTKDKVVSTPDQQLHIEMSNTGTGWQTNGADK